LGASVLACASCTGRSGSAIDAAAAAGSCVRDQLMNAMAPAAKIAIANMPAAGKLSQEWLLRVRIKARHSRATWQIDIITSNIEPQLDAWI
jgi:hypothetical protein